MPQLCIVTEFLENGSLFQFIFSDTKIDGGLVMNLAKGIAAGMSHLHKEGICALTTYFIHFRNCPQRFSSKKHIGKIIL